MAGEPDCKWKLPEAEFTKLGLTAILFKLT
jgi:hypothetical protein